VSVKTKKDTCVIFTNRGQVDPALLGQRAHDQSVKVVNSSIFTTGDRVEDLSSLCFIYPQGSLTVHTLAKTPTCDNCDFELVCIITDGVVKEGVYSSLQEVQERIEISKDVEHIFHLWTAYGEKHRELQKENAWKRCLNFFRGSAKSSLTIEL